MKRLSLNIALTASFLVISFLFPPSFTTSAKRIKLSLKVNKTTGKTKEAANPIHSLEQVCADKKTILTNEAGDSLTFNPQTIKFAGYDKEAAASLESFLLVNGSEFRIKHFRIIITYYDLKNRMLHSREVEHECIVPPGETRKIDIPSWDKQKTYYYYLGNAPRKTATPYKVSISPLLYWIE